MDSKLPEYDLFCKEPESKCGIAEAKERWRELVQSNAEETISRSTERLHDQTSLDRFRTMKALDAARLGSLLTTLQRDSSKLMNLAILCRDELASYQAKLVGIEIQETSIPIFTQVFEGVVTSISETHVAIEFKVDDDLEVRTFAVGDLDAPGYDLKEGQGVQVRCHLEAFPLTKAMSREEIEKWKDQYQHVQGYRKKAKRGRNLLEGDGA